MRFNLLPFFILNLIPINLNVWVINIYNSKNEKNLKKQQIKLEQDRLIKSLTDQLEQERKRLEYTKEQYQIRLQKLKENNEVFGD